MHAQFYERPRNLNFEKRPMIAQIFAFKADAERNGMAIRQLVLSEEEYLKLEKEVISLSKDVNFKKLTNIPDAITNFIGMPFRLFKANSKLVAIPVDKAS